MGTLHSSTTLGTFLRCSQRWCHHLQTQTQWSTPPSGCQSGRVQTLCHHIKKRSFPTIFPSKSTLGFASGTQTLTKGNFQPNLKALFFGFLALYYHSCLLQLMTLYRGIGGWVTIQSSSCWFSETWARTQLTPFLPVNKDIHFRDTLRHGRPWLNYASSSLFMRSANHAQDSSASNQVQTTPGQKLTLTMASPPQKFFQISSDWY